MPSEKPKSLRKRDEEKLYEPIKKALATVFAFHYIEKRKKPMREPICKRNPHLEITANGKFSETLKREFDDKTLNILSTEKLRPDVMGFVQKKSSSPKELIIVEVKASPIKIVDVSKAKLYQDIFNATFSLVVSPRGIPEEKLRLVLDKDAIRGKVIIAKFVQFAYALAGVFQIHPKFPNVLDPFKTCVVRE